MAGTHVSETDAFTLQLERDPILRSTIVAVAVFDRAPDWERFTDRIDRATRLAPTFRQKLVPSPLRVIPPRWVTDPDFDLSWHLRRMRVAAGGGMAAVLELARTSGMAAFDPERPLWEFTLLEGLPDDRAALVMKVHHALTDGIGGVRLAAHVVDLARDPGDLGALPEAPGADGRGRLDPVTDLVSHTVRRAVDSGRFLARGIPAAVVGATRDPVGATTGTVSAVRSIARFVRPMTSTLSPVMTGRRLRWHYDTLDVPLAPLKAASATVGGTLNDAFLGGITGGFRRYHERHGQPVEELRMTMPVNVRSRADESLGGNQVTLVRFAVPVAEPDPARRMREIGEAARALRQEPAIAYTNQIARAFNLLPVAVTGGMLKHVDLVASNVPGFDFDVFVGGARLEAFYAFGPTIGSSANITLMSYHGTCHIGVNTDGGAVPDPHELTACLRAGFDEVLALAPG